MLKRARLRWRLGGQHLAHADRGERVVYVPAWMAAQVQAFIWTRAMWRAQERWAARASRVTLPAWQEAMFRGGARLRPPQPAPPEDTRA